MQTFLPFASFPKSAAALDYRRLGKQRVEAYQILIALTKQQRGEKYGWQSHPATVMWRGYESALALYHDCCIVEWVKRGYKNSMPLRAWTINPDLPPFIGDEDFHRSHRGVLFRKDPVYYAAFEPDHDVPIVWPAAA